MIYFLNPCVMRWRWAVIGMTWSTVVMVDNSPRSSPWRGAGGMLPAWHYAGHKSRLSWDWKFRLELVEEVRAKVDITSYWIESNRDLTLSTRRSFCFCQNARHTSSLGVIEKSKTTSQGDEKYHNVSCVMYHSESRESLEGKCGDIPINTHFFLYSDVTFEFC